MPFSYSLRKKCLETPGNMDDLVSVSTDTRSSPFFFQEQLSAHHIEECRFSLAALKGVFNDSRDGAVRQTEHQWKKYILPAYLIHCWYEPAHELDNRWHIEQQHFRCLTCTIPDSGNTPVLID